MDLILAIHSSEDSFIMVSLTISLRSEVHSLAPVTTYTVLHRTEIKESERIIAGRSEQGTGWLEGLQNCTEHWLEGLKDCTEHWLKGLQDCTEHWQS